MVWFSHNLTANGRRKRATSGAGGDCVDMAVNADVKSEEFTLQLKKGQLQPEVILQLKFDEHEAKHLTIILFCFNNHKK